MSVQVCVPMSLLQRLKEVLCVILHLFWLLLFWVFVCLFFGCFFCSKTGFLTEPEAHSNFPRRLSSPGALQTYLAPLSDDGVTGTQGRVLSSPLFPFDLSPAWFSALESAAVSPPCKDLSSTREEGLYRVMNIKIH